MACLVNGLCLGSFWIVQIALELVEICIRTSRQLLRRGFAEAFLGRLEGIPGGDQQRFVVGVGSYG